MQKIIYDYETKSFSCIEVREFGERPDRAESRKAGHALGKQINLVGTESFKHGKERRKALESAFARGDLYKYTKLRDYYNSIDPANRDSIERGVQEQARAKVKELNQNRLNNQFNEALNKKSPMQDVRDAALDKYLRKRAAAAAPVPYAKSVSDSKEIKPGKTSWSDRIRAKVLDAKDKVAEAAHNTKEQFRSGVEIAKLKDTANRIDKFNTLRAIRQLNQ